MVTLTRILFKTLYSGNFKYFFYECLLQFLMFQCKIIPLLKHKLQNLIGNVKKF